MTVRCLVACAAVAVAGAMLPAHPFAQADGQAPAAQQPPARVFHLGTNLVRVDVVVRDKDGQVVTGLTADDFAIAEDGKPQMITSFDVEQIATERLPELTSTPALLGRDRLQEAAARAATTTPSAAAAPAAAGVAPEDLPGRRLIVLLFDTSSMQPEEIDRAVQSASDYVDKGMSAADLVAVATVGQTLSVLGDFTADRAELKRILATFDSTSGTGFEQPAAADTTDTSSTDTSTDAADLPLDDSEFGIFNNDRRLRALRVLCEALAPIEQKKAILYFSAGMSRSGSDNQVELRAVTNAANKANTSIYPVDSRGLMAVVPGGAAGRGGGGGFGSSAFSGRSMLNQFSALGSSQETLTTLAADTGGEAFLDTNDFAPAFTRVQHDMSAYYLLGYSSTNPAQDGKFRRIAVTLKHPVPGYQVEARRGYYAPTDFAHLRKEDRERQLEDQISAAVSSTDLPVVASTSWFRVSGDRFYVPVSVAVPGSAVRLPGPDAKDRGEATIDLLGVVTDEQGRSVGRIRDVMRIPADQAADLAGKQLQYQSGVLLPAGHFKVKVAARENTDGTMGTFEFPITIPDLQTEPVKVSPVVFSTQVRQLAGRGRGFRGRMGGGGPRGGFGGFGGPGFRSERGGRGAQWSANSQNPLLRDGQEIVQSLTHVATAGQAMYFYYEVYDPALSPGGAPKIDTSLAFYRGRVKVFETPVVEHTTIDAPDRHAVVFQFELPADDLEPGLYTCQVNVIDEVAGRFAFPRLAVYVRGR